MEDKIIQRFFSKIKKTDGCWIWQSHKDWQGYGKFSYYEAGKRVWKRAHKLMYILRFGVFDNSLLVCHKCDNPSCVNPEHLFLGTYKDNNNDAVRKGRYKAPSGEQHWTKRQKPIRDESGKFKKSH